MKFPNASTRCLLAIVATLSIACKKQCFGFRSSFVRTTPRKRTPTTHLSMALKVQLRIVGRKQSEKWIEEGCQMYETRMRTNRVTIDTSWHKDNSALITHVKADWSRNLPVILLDPYGDSMSSEQFADSFYAWMEDGGSRLVLVIGGAEGLPKELRNHKGAKLLSLSQLTFTHQFARLVLFEQIYRATEIRKGSGYHK